MTQQAQITLAVRRYAPGIARTGRALHTRGMTLIEVMLAVAIVIIAALGTLCYEYFCMHHIQFARAQVAATRIGQLLLEDWKSTGGSADYDPEELDMGIGATSGTVWGDYMTVIDDRPLFIAMNHSDIDNDDFAGVTLRRIDVSVRWRKDLGNGSPGAEDPAVNLSTYVRQDQ
jgi:prepilin-type N-terminal cleavage/methylation domain-containing protein